MNKWMICLVSLIVVGLGCLINIVWQSKADLVQANAQLSRLNSEYAKLNDQVVALQRQQQSVEKSVQRAPVADDIVPAQAAQQLNAELKLVEVALQYEQPMFALSHLMGLRVRLEEFILSDALRNSVAAAIQNDIASIEHYLMQVDQQNETIQLHIEKINHALLQEAKHPQLSRESSKSHGLGWFDIKRDDTQTAPMFQRSLILKEVQLRLQLLQYAVARQQQLIMVNEMQDIIALLALLPDAFAEQQIEQLKQLQQMQLSKPRLSALALLGATT